MSDSPIFSNHCLNCNKDVLDNKVFCDELCKYGWRCKQYRLLDKAFKKVLDGEDYGQ